MTAQLAADLQHNGQLFLDAPAELYVPELAALNDPPSDSRRVMVRDLLNHTAGFVTDDPRADRQIAITHEQFDDGLASAEPFSYAPEETWEYSNLGYAMTGRIIENVSGESYEQRLH